MASYTPVSTGEVLDETFANDRDQVIRIMVIRIGLVIRMYLFAIRMTRNFTIRTWTTLPLLDINF